MRKKNKVAKAENHERWLLTYADLITLLLVFFIVLYAGSQADQAKYSALAEGLRDAFSTTAIDGAGGSSAVFTGSGSANAAGSAQELADFNQIAAILTRVAEERDLEDRVKLRMEPDRIVIDLTSDLLFTSGSAGLRATAAPVLTAVADSLRGKPNEVRIEGHTDNVPINTTEYNSNWELSAARATAVLRWLVTEGRLPAERLFAAAYGEARPKADNATPEGRGANRRAEIVILYPQTGAAPASAPAGAGQTATPAPARKH